ncbi:MAG: TlpA family protein disulfide reductase [Candidatus Methylacidiphilales bacterium]
MKQLIKSMLVATAILGVLGLTQLHALEPAQPKVVGLMFYSDTCGSCKILDPKIESVKKDYVTQPILFATLDHSNEGSKNQAALLAETLGLGKVYAAQEKASGFLLLVNPQSGEVITKLTRDMSEADIKAAFDQALNS